MLLLQEEVLFQISFEMVPDFDRILDIEGDTEVGFYEAFRVEIQDLRIRRVVDDGEVAEVLEFVELPVDDDAVLSNLYEDAMGVLATREHEDDGRQEDEEREQEIRRHDRVNQKNQGRGRHVDVPSWSAIALFPRRDFPCEGILGFHDLTQDLLAVGHTTNSVSCGRIWTKGTKDARLHRQSGRGG